MSSGLLQTHLESCLLEKMAKFGSDVFETLLLPVYLICTHTKEKYTDVKFLL